MSTPLDSTPPVVLLLADFLPYPATSGNRKRVASLVSAIQSWGYTVHLLALDLGFDKTAIESTRREVDFYSSIPSHPELDPWGRSKPRTWFGRLVAKIGRHARQCLGKWPVALDPDLEQRCPETYREAVRQTTRETRPIAVIAEYIWLSKCLCDLPRTTLKMIDSHDAMHRRLEEFRGTGLYSYFHCSLEDELKCFNRADKVLMIQEEELRCFSAHLPQDRLLLIPHAHAICPPPSKDSSSQSLLFVGAAHASNVEGLTWFIESVWPRVIADHPRCILRIAGRVGEAIQGRIGNSPEASQIEILGMVDSVVEESHRASLAINPIIRGSGLKVKVVEALCSGLPVVSTTKGVEGISGLTGCEAVRIADTPQDFAREVSSLLSHPDDLTRSAIAFAESKFSVHSAYAPLRDLLEGVANRPAGVSRIPPSDSNGSKT